MAGVQRRLVPGAVKHVIVLLIGFIMVYPLAWMLMSSFKESSIIFHYPGLIT